MRGQGTIFAIGARTPIGLDAKQTALLMRTGLPALTSAPLATPQGTPVTMAYDTTIDPYVVGEERASRLAACALRELANAVGPTARNLKARAVLAFPEPRPAQSQSDLGRVLATHLGAAIRETFGDLPVEVATRGPAGLAYELPDALTALATRQVDAVIAGGVHSDYDPEQILALDTAGRLFTQQRIDAVIPGECAAFVLIGRDDFGLQIGKPPLARIHSIAAETSEITPYDDHSALDATALSGVLRECISVLPDGLKVGWAIGDHGCEQFRLRELYSALTRTSSSWCPPIAIDGPAQRIGQLGAAALPLGLVLASDMFYRGYAPTPFGIVFAGSDGGERAAILVGSP